MTPKKSSVSGIDLGYGGAARRGSSYNSWRTDTKNYARSWPQGTLGDLFDVFY